MFTHVINHATTGRVLIVRPSEWMQKQTLVKNGLLSAIV
jgi:hypothetical protein